MSLDARISSLADYIDALHKDVATDEAARKRLLQVLQGAQAVVESPMETLWRLIMSPHAPSALMVLIRSGVVAALVTGSNTRTPQTAAQLAATTGAAEALITRMMRPLTALGIFHETSAQTYAAAPVAELLAGPALVGGYQFMFDLATRSLANLPRYLERTGFQDVDDAQGPFQDCNGTQDGMFPYLMRHPDMMANFNAFMAGSLAARADWFAKFDAQALVVDGADGDDPDAVLLVDVGGGEGHDLEAFARAFPHAPGRLVLQDLPPVIASIDNTKMLENRRIVRQAHDMFGEQPVRGARAYYMRNIYHDWPDAACVKIMRRIAEAMVPGYSKLLIFEWVLPAKDVPLYPALLDVNMMALLNGRERTEAQWTALLEAAGLKVTKFHHVAPDEEGLIEAELA